MSQIQQQVSYHLKLGVFLAIGALLLASGIFFIGQMRNLFSRTFSVYAVFSDVDGLQAGNNVRFGGMHIGSIQSVAMISDTSIRVFMIIEKNMNQFIADDAIATIGSDGLMGNKLLIISPGSALHPRIKADAEIRTQMPPRLDELLHRLSSTIQNVTQITADLAIITSKISRGKGTIGKLLLDTVFAENLDRSIVHIEKGTRSFEQAMDGAKNSFLLKGLFNKKEKKPAKVIKTK